MEQALNVLLFTHNSLTCQSFMRYTKQQEDFHLISVTDNTDFVKDISLSQDVDILILDLEDEDQSNDVIKLIDAFYTYLQSCKPYILVITGIENNDILDHIHDAGADFIISKNKPDYSVQLVFNFLRLVHERPKTPCRSHHDYYPRMLQIICEELDAAGINHCHVGYQYLAESILLFLEGKHLHLCSTLGARHKKSALSVTRAMQNAIDYAWKNTHDNSRFQTEDPDLTLIHAIDTQSERGIPTVSEFIRYCVYKIRNM